LSRISLLEIISIEKFSPADDEAYCQYKFPHRKLAECSKTRRSSDAAAWTETAKEKPVFRIW
jgi:hypothetical protein